MPFTSHLASIRFGTGLSPRIAPPASPDEMVRLLTGPDRIGEAIPMPTFLTVDPSLLDYKRATQARNRVRGTPEEEAAHEAMRALQRQARRRQRDFLMRRMARAATTEDGLRERLERFWADHFTVKSSGPMSAHLVAVFAEEAIRPHVTGRFSDMLRAAMTHPMMLSYLDQNRSFGPNSQRAKRRGGGLNENLARELLELHTLGVDGPYGQSDVRQLAELLTGMAFTQEEGFVYRTNFVEPGAETVLGSSYGGGAPSVDHVFEALDDLARHPATARHLSEKMARHFVSDEPSEDLVQTLTAAFRDTEGDLLVMTAQLLEHPDAWSPELKKVKPPRDFMESTLRALGVRAADLTALDRKPVDQIFAGPMQVMGQSIAGPSGPDGWPEDPASWITPQGMAGRIGWSMKAPSQVTDALPDPRDFVRTALGQQASEAVVFAAGAAETPAEGIGIVLSSPDFQRR
ncbi:DUF1800 domain-containing protein [Aestuariibius insulae]|uniref:DUF1800 domain-containing protein n=1 Tax=Aestuariibius insulae TaxID=2058287 RepID=UPI00345E2489